MALGLAGTAVAYVSHRSSGHGRSLGAAGIVQKSLRRAAQPVRAQRAKKRARRTAAAPTHAVAPTPAGPLTNSPPTASDDSYSVTDGGSLNVAAPGVLANDSDPDSGPGPLQASLVSAATIHGTLALRADGGFDYTPVPSFQGTDTFTYQANDGAADSNVATVSIAVSQPDTLTVNSAGDAAGSCNPDPGTCTLREAIAASNAIPGTQTIAFDIAGGGVQTISPASALPTITDTVVIDGYTQPGASPNTLASGDNASIEIFLDGTNAGASVDGLKLSAGSSVVRGLAIGNFRASGIHVVSGGGDSIEGNFIGTDASGASAQKNLVGVMGVTAANEIGGTTPAARNLISGNQQDGVQLIFGTADGNLVQGNYIGTDATGSAALPNTGAGIDLSGAQNTTIGGSSDAARNVISGNHGGVFISGSSGPGSSNTVVGNYIGTDASGSHALGNLAGIQIVAAPNNVVRDNVISASNFDGVTLQNGSTGNVLGGNLIGTDATGSADLDNGGYGVQITSGAGSNLIGGTTTADRNVISGNDRAGVFVDTGSSSDAIEGNYIGLDASGLYQIGNAADGIVLQGSDTTVGGAGGGRNVISGNSFDGVLVNSGSGNVIRNNLIGTDAGGVSPVVNTGDGIAIAFGKNNQIGGTDPGAANVIAFNLGSGVSVVDDGVTLATGNSILGNSIYANGGLGIDLGADGVTPNDPGDGDTGPNELQNFPVITSVTPGAGQTTVKGTLDGSASRIEIAFADACDSSGFGKGGTFLAATAPASDGSFQVDIPGVLSPGQTVSATATDSNGNTSEYSACAAASNNHAPDAANDNYTTTQETPLVVSSAASGVLANDSDPDNDTLTAVKDSDPTNGTVDLHADGTFTYTPNPGFVGFDSFTYHANDGQADSGSATVFINVTPAPATAHDDHASTTRDTPAAIDVLANDEPAGVQIESNTQPSHGSASCQVNGPCTYVPAAGFTGTDSFTYTITDGSNESTGTVTVDVTEPGSSGLQVQVGYADDLRANPANFPLPWDGSPNVLFRGESPRGGPWDDGAVRLVNPTGNPIHVDKVMVTFPGADRGSFQNFQANLAPEWNDFTVDPGKSAIVTATSGDNFDSSEYGPGPCGSPLSADSAPIVTVVVGGVSYSGRDTGRVLDTDGIDPPICTGDNESHAWVPLGTSGGGNAGATLTLSPGTQSHARGDQATLTAHLVDGGGDPIPGELVTFTASNDSPNHGDLGTALTDGNGDAVFQYTSTFGGTDTDSASVSTLAGSFDSNNATVTWANTAPVAHDDSYSVVQDNVLDVPAPGPLVNDTDPDGDALTADMVTTTAHGNLVINSDGSFTYTPNSGYVGPDSFTYRASDGVAESDPATVSIDVQPSSTSADLQLTKTDSADPVSAGDTFSYSLLVHNAGPGAADGVSVYDSLPPSFNYSSVSTTSGSCTGGQTVQCDLGTVEAGAANDVTITITGSAIADGSGSIVNTATVSSNTVDPFPSNNSDSESTAVQTATPPTEGQCLSYPDFSSTSGMNLIGSAARSGTALRLTPANFDLQGQAWYTGKVSVNDGFRTDFNFQFTGMTGIGDEDGPGADGITFAIQNTAIDETGDVGGALGYQGIPDSLVVELDTFNNGPGSGDPNGNHVAVHSRGAAANGPGPEGDSLLGAAPLTPFMQDGNVHHARIQYDGAGILAIYVDDMNRAALTVPVNIGTLLTLDAGKAFVGFTGATGAGAENQDVLNWSYCPNTPNSLFAHDDSYNVAQDTTLTVNGVGVLLNDDPSYTVLTAHLLEHPAHGTVALNTDGSFVYTPDSGYSGPDSFTYKANDGTADSNAATVSINVQPVAATPVAADDAYSTNEDTLLHVGAPGVLGNDSPSSGLTAAVVDGPSHGTLTLNADGSFDYTPDSGYSGADSFTYKANDGTTDSNVATVSITVNAVNEPPVATDDSYATPENTALTIDAPGVLGNDTDAEGDPLTAALVDSPTNGTVTLNPDGSFTYTPNADYTGPDSFTYKANDGTSDSNLATVSIDVNAPAAPTLSLTKTSSADTVDPGGAFSYSIVVGDNGPGGVTGVTVTDPLPGNVGFVSATPTQGSCSEATQTVTCDVGALAEGDTATITIDVTAPSQAASLENTATASSNETDPVEASASTTVQSTQPGVKPFTTVRNTDYVTAGYGGMRGGDGTGTLTVSGVSGSVKRALLYWQGPTNTTDPNANAGVSFAGHAVMGTNIGFSSDNCWGFENSQAYRADVTSYVTGNGTYDLANFIKGDADINGVSLIVFFDDGNASNNRDVVIFNGNDSNIANPYDAAGWDVNLTGINYTSGTASLGLHVGDGQNFPDDALVVNGTTIVPAGDIFQGDSVPNGPNDHQGGLWDIKNFDVTSLLTPGSNTLHLTTGLNSDCLSLVAATVDLPAGAAPPTTDVSIDDVRVTEGNSGTTDATFTVTRSGPTTGTSHVDFATADGTATVADGDYAATSGTLTFAPGETTKTITVKVNGDTKVEPDETFFVNLNSTDANVVDDQGIGTIVNDDGSSAPVAHDDAYSTNEDTTLHQDAPGVLGNDTPGSGLTAALVANASHGNVTLNADGSFTYVPNANYHGSDSFTYKANDGTNDSNVATVSITVNSVNDPPDCASNSFDYFGTEDTPLSSRLVCDDVDGDSLHYSLVPGFGPAHGTVTVHDDGTFDYTPDPNFNGVDSFKFSVDDGNGGTDEAVANLYIDAVNDSPVANPDSASTNEDTQVTTGDVLANDTPGGGPDESGQTLSVTGFTQPAHGHVVDNGDGTFTYTPDPNFNGVDTFTYTVSDDGVPPAAATGTVTITVAPVNDPPSLSPFGAITIDEGSSSVPIDLDSHWSDVETTAPDATFTAQAADTSGAPHVSTSLFGHSLTVGGADDGTGTVTVKGTDTGDGASPPLSATQSFDVTVVNVAPTVTPPADQTANAGESKSFSLGSFGDPGIFDDPWAVEINWGDGTTPDSFSTATQGSLGSLDHTFASSGPHTVTVTVTDKDGGVGTASFTVDVANESPVLTAPANQSADEGTPHLFDLGSFTDANNDGPWTVEVDWDYSGVFSAGSTFSAATTGALSATHTYADGPSGHTVAVRVTDQAGGSDLKTFTVSVANIAPTVTAPADQTVDEGSFASIALGSFTDPGAQDSPWAVKVDWGDGTNVAFSQPTTGSLGNLSHTYDDGPNDYTVTVTVTDKDGGSDSASFTVHVANVDPTATFDAQSPVDEGQSFTLSLTSPHDPSSADTTAGFQYQLDCGDGSGFGPLGATSSVSCPTTQSGVRHVRGRIVDKDGGSTTYTADVTVRNLAPVVTGPANQTADEGTSKSFDLGSFTDAAGNLDQPFAVTVDWGDGSPNDAFTKSTTGALGSLAHTFADGPHTYTVTVSVTDKDGDTGHATFTVDVANVAPVVTAPADQSADEGVSTSFDLGSFTDPGADSPWTVDVNWGDGSPTTTMLQVQQGIHAANHTYNDGPGASPYLVTVTVTDKDGAHDTKTFHVNVNNVAPTGTFNTPFSVDEGKTFPISVSNVADVQADLNAGIQVAFDCGSGYGAFGTALQRTCPGLPDNGTVNVGVKLKDKDGGVREYTALVVVNNVAPRVTITGPANGTHFHVGDLVTVQGNYLDVPADTETVGAGFGAGAPLTFGTVNPSARTWSVTGTFAAPGTATITIYMTDDDGGTGTARVTVNVDP